MNTDELVSSFIDILRKAGTHVAIDLTGEPPVILARAPTGRVFAAAWSDDGVLRVRLRLDAMPSFPELQLEFVGEGDLGYEATIRRREDIESLTTTLARAYALATRVGLG